MDYIQWHSIFILIDSHSRGKRTHFLNIDDLNSTTILNRNHGFHVYCEAGIQEFVKMLEIREINCFLFVHLLPTFY